MKNLEDEKVRTEMRLQSQLSELEQENDELIKRLKIQRINMLNQNKLFDH